MMHHLREPISYKLLLLFSISCTPFSTYLLHASFFGGTSLLIVVGVGLDTLSQIESHLLSRHYDGFLTKGKVRSRRG